MQLFAKYESKSSPRQKPSFAIVKINVKTNSDITNFHILQFKNLVSRHPFQLKIPWLHWNRIKGSLITKSVIHTFPLAHLINMLTLEALIYTR